MLIVPKDMSEIIDVPISVGFKKDEFPGGVMVLATVSRAIGEVPPTREGEADSFQVVLQELCFYFKK